MLIDVTIDVRDLDPTLAAAPIGARVAFARLSPATAGGVMVTTDAVMIPLDTNGHGVTKLTAATGYWVHCYGFNGFDASFAVMTGTVATSLGELWRTGQIDPTGFGALPVPQTVEQALAAQAASVAATHLSKVDAAALYATKPVALTQAAYDALPVKNPSTLYLIVDQ